QGDGPRLRPQTADVETDLPLTALHDGQLVVLAAPTDLRTAHAFTTPCLPAGGTPRRNSSEPVPNGARIVYPCSWAPGTGGRLTPRASRHPRAACGAAAAGAG